MRVMMPLRNVWYSFNNTVWWYGMVAPLPCTAKEEKMQRDKRRIIMHVPTHPSQATGGGRSFLVDDVSL